MTTAGLCQRKKRAKKQRSSLRDQLFAARESPERADRIMGTLTTLERTLRRHSAHGLLDGVAAAVQLRQAQRAAFETFRALAGPKAPAPRRLRVPQASRCEARPAAFMQRLCGLGLLNNADVGLLGPFAPRGPAQLFSLLGTFPTLARALSNPWLQMELAAAFAGALEWSSRAARAMEEHVPVPGSGAHRPTLPATGSAAGDPPAGAEPGRGGPRAPVGGIGGGQLVQGTRRILGRLDRPWPLRFQGGRQTCVAHSMVAAVEQWTASDRYAPSYSEQYLHWAIKHDANRDLYRGYDGTSLGEGDRSIQKFGVCSADLWPYDATCLDDNFAHHDHPMQPRPTPPARADADGRRIRARTYVSPPDGTPGTAQAIYDCLRDGPLAISLLVFHDPENEAARPNNWENRYSAATGRVQDVPRNSRYTRERGSGHAVCVVGFVPVETDKAAGGGLFLFRNSWGTAWGNGRDPGAPDIGAGRGYGEVSAQYIEDHCYEIWQP